MKGFLVLLFLLLGSLTAQTGPPFVTDDPEPVDYQHWEFYIAAQHIETSDGWSGTAPHVEVNYGAITNLQLHLIAPLAYDAPRNGPSHYGFGDTEIGAKYRFIQETEHLPQVGIFPLAELPTGSESAALGSGRVQAFLPVWLQKSWGEEDHKWTAYGGGGYDINPGASNRNWTFLGLVLQRQITDRLLLGGEIYHRTATMLGEQADTAFNLGTVIDFSNHHHLLFSAGRSIVGPTEFQIYTAYQLTFGPRK